ncbi:Ig-like domain-containing protein [Riemerella anatipestifer]|uniref:Ig-like domain-containing protein n=2 Tax=Riemerella anatipestifer TaxID=34085 RepID=UPI00066CC58E|nr:Ig-like domain-containing protein [Riemerella anatipestifer]MCU7574444.1 Ig-like domain-containing protein [Riemerella anatipestifer]MCU7595271.1 Ig-like domain-containing protein [Riemerella anatipestifer]MDR7634305.1 Ig-like domain-containing protein [Riemerella anatipestifer]MDR7684243.1 Ig-like domain-containing protein [Riemerella anatipestifer]MDR7733085.1 Ig-like domain-containing protein [Riemerella anatipestifer]
MIKKIQLKLYIFLTMLGIFTSYNAQSWVIWDNLGDGTTAGASTIGVGSATSNPITGKVTVVPSFGAAAGKLNIFSAGSGLIQPPSGLYNNFAGASISNNVLKLESSQYANELVSITFNFEKEVIIEDLVVTDLDKNIKTSIFDNSQEWDDSFDITLDNGATFTSVSYGVSNGGNIAQGYAGATITTSSFDAGTYRSSDSRGSEWIRWVKSSAPTKTIKITFKLPNDLPRTRAAMSYYAIKVSSANLIDAVDDNFGVVSSGGKTGSVFANDKSSDGSVPTSLNTDVSLVNLGGLTGATINPDGTINIPANAAAGNYVLTYRICSPKGQTTNCDTATVTLSIAASKCYNSPTDNSSSVPVNHGVTVLGRAGVDNGNWPMIRNSAYTVLEGKTKGFVLTRNSNPEGTIVNPVVGMMVFDTDENSGKGCLKIYTGSGVGEGWKCFNTQTCP